MSAYLRITRNNRYLATIPITEITHETTDQIFNVELAEIQAGVGADRLQLTNVDFVAQRQHNIQHPL